MPYIMEEPQDAASRSGSRHYTSTSSSRNPHAQSYSQNQTSHASSTTGYWDAHGHWQPVERSWGFTDGEPHRQATMASATRYTSQQSQYSYPNSRTPTSSTSSAQSSTYTTASPSNNHHTTTPLSLTNLSQHTNTPYSHNENLHAWATASQRSGPWDGVGHVLVERSSSRRDGGDARYYDREGREGRGRRNNTNGDEYY